MTTPRLGCVLGIQARDIRARGMASDELPIKRRYEYLDLPPTDISDRFDSWAAGIKAGD